MLRAPEPVLMVIADVSGYTRYLVGTELEHAQDVLADLLEVIASNLEPPLTLLAVEGDACFAFAPADMIEGQQLLDVLDACYFGFRRRLRDIGQATSCRCRACSRIPDLDLKFVAHVGQAVRQRVGRQETLAGPDVIAVHRLLKNTVAETLGHRGYAFFSDACATRLGLRCRDMGMRPHSEHTDVAEIGGSVADLAVRWTVAEAMADRRLPPDRVLDRLVVELPAAPAVVWAWLTEPDRRMRYQEGNTGFERTMAAGRVEVGTLNHCMHGPDVIVEHILQWRPFHDVVLSAHFPGAFDVVLGYELEPASNGGTRVTFSAGGLDDPELVEAWRSVLGPEVMSSVAGNVDRLRQLLLDEATPPTAAG